MKWYLDFSFVTPNDSIWKFIVLATLNVCVCRVNAWLFKFSLKVIVVKLKLFSFCMLNLTQTNKSSSCPLVCFAIFYCIDSLFMFPVFQVSLYCCCCCCFNMIKTVYKVWSTGTLNLVVSFRSISENWTTCWTNLSSFDPL